MLFRVVFVDFSLNFLHFLLKLGYFGNTFLELKIKYFPIIKYICISWKCSKKSIFRHEWVRTCQQSYKILCSGAIHKRRHNYLTYWTPPCPSPSNDTIWYRRLHFRNHPSPISQTTSTINSTSPNSLPIFCPLFDDVFYERSHSKFYV